MNVSVNLVDRSSFVLSALHDAIEVGTNAVALEAKKYAKELCPVDTGNLKLHIEGYASKYNTATLGDAVEYATDVECGTSRQRAQPYFGPAIKNHIPKYQALWKYYIQNA